MKIKLPVKYSELTPAERKQFIDTTQQRDQFVRMAEREAINAAVSYQHFQAEIQSAEKTYVQFNRQMTGRHLPEQKAEQDLALKGSEQRRNGLPASVVVYQTLKELDHEL